MQSPIRVAVTGAAGQIGYSLIPLIATGQVFGVNQPVILHLVDIPRAAKMLDAVHMELQDGAYPLLQDVVCATNPAEGFNGVQYAILVGGFPRLKGMQRSDLLAKNSPIFVEQGKALNDHADPNVKVLVVANPANTNCLIAATNAPKIPKENFSCLTRLDHNRALYQLTRKVGAAPGTLRNVTIWGNHSATMYVDASNAVVSGQDGDKSVSEAVNDEAWLGGEFLTTVQQRGASVIAARGLSSAMSAANAVKDHMVSWLQGTKEGEHVSMGVYSDGSYGVEKGLMFSFPVTCANGAYTIKQGVKLSENAQKAIKTTEAELVKEKGIALGAQQ